MSDHHGFRYHRYACGALIVALLVVAGALAVAAGGDTPGTSIRVEPRPIDRAGAPRSEGAEISFFRLDPDAERLARRFGVGRRLAAIITRQAREAGVEPAMAFGIIAIESGFDPHAIGREGERGLMQIKPSTARAYDRRITAQALHDPALNVRLGLRHLTREVEFFGDRSLGLMSYRMGRARLEREMADGVPPRDGYAERVLSICGPDCA